MWQPPMASICLSSTGTGMMDSLFLESTVNNGFLKAKNNEKNEILPDVGQSPRGTQLLECTPVQRMTNRVYGTVRQTGITSKSS